MFCGVIAEAEESKRAERQEAGEPTARRAPAQAVADVLRLRRRCRQHAVVRVGPCCLPRLRNPPSYDASVVRASLRAECRCARAGVRSA